MILLAVSHQFQVFSQSLESVAVISRLSNVVNQTCRVIDNSSTASLNRADQYLCLLLLARLPVSELAYPFEFAAGLLEAQRLRSFGRFDLSSNRPI